jgi:hypothetical protein
MPSTFLFALISLLIWARSERFFEYDGFPEDLFCVAGNFVFGNLDGSIFYLNMSWARIVICPAEQADQLSLET